MPIEFSCPECGKLLSTGDDKAGRTAKCPGCSAPITVPGRPLEAGGFEGGADDASRTGAEEKVRQPCPVCGELILAGSRVCRYCGEGFSGSTGSMPAGSVPDGLKAEMPVIWKKTWAIYKANLGISVALTLLAGMINFVAAIPQTGLRGAYDQGLLEASVFFPSFGLSLILGWAVQFWMSAGLVHCMLKLARGDVPEVSELFSGGRWFWRMTGSSIVFWLAVYVGLALCAFPGIFAALALWPYQYFIVDENDGVSDSLNRAYNLTKGKYTLGIELAVYSFGLGCAGIVMCCVGLIFTTPLISLLSAMTYLALRVDYQVPRDVDDRDQLMV